MRMGQVLAILIGVFALLGPELTKTPSLAAGQGGAGAASASSGVDADNDARWWLSVFFLREEGWVPGGEVSTPGWSPRAYPDRETCMKRMAFGKQYCRTLGVAEEVRWFCNEGEPVVEPVEGMQGEPC